MEITMSLTDNFRRNRPGQGRKALPEFEVPKVEGKLAQARAAVEAAEAKHAGLSFDYARGLIDHGVVAQATQEVTTARQLVETLEAALRVAEEHDKEAQTARRLHTQKNNLQQVKRHLDARDEAAKQLASAVADVVRAYRALQDFSKRATECLPIGLTEFPAHHAFAARTIERLVSHEFYRQSHSGTPGHTLPGAASPDIMHRDNATAIRPLADAVTETSAFVMTKLEALVPDAVPSKWLRDREKEGVE
jgi:hypothetical protein